MTAQELIAWRERLGLTQPQAAFALGVSLRGYQKREADEAPIDREAQLATRYLEEHPEELPWQVRTGRGAVAVLFGAKDRAISHAIAMLEADEAAKPQVRQLGPAGSVMEHAEIVALRDQLS
ncbi:helix-turn-helix domain-containing protein [Azospirillum argentinense]|uniref:XRE family transcriptional regulator n=1 Tax=Azospirillum brasilense TaxID=192 RepID=A0A4D8QA35_AZOBR|nr:helix-turn-helix domain-containing protein [Azospirillum argentinense]QCO03042.1 XRE family transcriptional regulator [Azospirillum argentinense]